MEPNGAPASMAQENITELVIDLHGVDYQEHPDILEDDNQEHPDIHGDDSPVDQPHTAVQDHPTVQARSPQNISFHDITYKVKQRRHCRRIKSKVILDSCR
jgi:hypothetical protein